MIALILGGAPSVFDEAQAAAALLNRRHLVVAANLAGIHWPGKLDGWVSLHGNLLPKWAEERAGEPAGRLFTVAATPERWPGSSGLYALQVALFELGASGAILCGVPLDSEAGHFDRPPGARWEAVGDYRQAFAAALPEIGGRIRSMGGWTANLFGRPTAAWVGAISSSKPAGLTASQQERAPMHRITNTTDETQKFWALDDQGVSKLYRVAPGKAVEATIDPNQPKFAEGGAFKVTALAEPAPKRKAAAKRATPRKPMKAIAKPAPASSETPATEA